jgi:hypothetical protein
MNTTFTDHTAASLNGHHEDLPGASWKRTDLTAVLNRAYEAPVPCIGSRDDGKGLFYPGRQHAVAAETESGKTWLALHASMTEIGKGNNVLYIDFEDDEGGIVTRLMSMGADIAAIRHHFIYVRPEEPVSTGSLSALLEYSPALVILDGITEAMSLHGMDLKDNDAYSRFGRMLPRRCARAGAAVVMMDHVVKNREARGGYAIGAVHKLNGLNGAMFILENTDPFGIGLEGRSKVFIRKDRPGQLRRHGIPGKERLIHYCDLAVKSRHEDFAECSLPVPGTVPEGGTGRAVKAMMAKVSRFLQGTDHPLSGNAVREQVGGKATTILAALEFLVNEGYAQVEKVGNAHKYSHVKLYEE